MPKIGLTSSSLVLARQDTTAQLLLLNAHVRSPHLPSLVRCLPQPVWPGPVLPLIRSSFHVRLGTVWSGTVKSSTVGAISERLFESLPPEEREHWHPHNYEILSGQLILPGVPDAVEKAALAKKINSYGKTWHIWDTGHAGHPAAHDLPIGKPLLAWSYNRDGEAPPELIAARDRRMKAVPRKSARTAPTWPPAPHPKVAWVCCGTG